MIIDAHNHPNWYGHQLDRYLENTRQCGIDLTWLLSWECPDDEYDHGFVRFCPDAGDAGPIPLSACLPYVERHPERFVLGYAPDPRRPEALDRLEAAIAAHGVRVYGELKVRMTYDDPDALRMFRHCGERRLPVVVHIDYEFDSGKRYPRPNWWYGGGIGALERAVRAVRVVSLSGMRRDSGRMFRATESMTGRRTRRGPWFPGEGSRRC